MKIFHISDLHIGKQLHYYSLNEEQRYILSRIVDKAEEYRPDVSKETIKISKKFYYYQGNSFYKPYNSL